MVVYATILESGVHPCSGHAIPGPQARVWPTCRLGPGRRATVPMTSELEPLAAPAGTRPLAVNQVSSHAAAPAEPDILHQQSGAVKYSVQFCRICAIIETFG